MFPGSRICGAAWALDEMTVWPTAGHRLLETRLMRRSLAGAAAIIMNTPEARVALAKRFPEFADRATVIPNGFDAADFDSPLGPR